MPAAPMFQQPEADPNQKRPIGVGAGGAAPQTPGVAPERNPDTGLIGAGAGGAAPSTAPGAAPTSSDPVLSPYAQMRMAHPDGGDANGPAFGGGPADTTMRGSGDLQTDFQSALVNKLNPQGVSANDPSIAPAIQANRLAEQRGVSAQRNALAEQAAASGTNMSGGNDALQRGILSDSAARQGQFSADALQHASDLQNQNQMAALGLSGDFLNNQANREQQNTQFGQSLGEQQAARAQQGTQFGQSLAEQQASRDQQNSQFGQSLTEQKRQSDLDAELKRLGINSQTQLGQGDLDLRKSLGEGNLNLGLLGLLQNGDLSRAQLDQSGLLGLLGML